ncbi:MAG: hypothetical protein Q9214_007449, partial [Letrouitia sp. 1 TL-2023]
MPSASNSMIRLLHLVAISLKITVYNHLSGITRRLSCSLDSKGSRAVDANSEEDDLLALVLEAMMRMGLPQDHNQLLELYQPAREMVELDEDERAKLLGKLEDSIRVGAINPSLTLILQTVIVVQSGCPTQREDVRLHLSRIFTHLCNCLFQPLSFQSTLLSMQTLSLMLQKLVRSTTQWHIDNTMAVITSAVAQPNPQTSPAQKGNIYLSACRLFSTILTLHRKRLSGRFHLVLLALQALLRCFFIPHTTLPSPDPDKSLHPYSTPHAAALSKLLSQLCSPAFSAVAKRRKDDRHLNDPVKKERDKVGRYMHIWLHTYCKCLLEGYLENEEVRKEVERGVGIVIDCVPAEGLRVLNAGMDAEGRG